MKNKLGSALKEKNLQLWPTRGENKFRIGNLWGEGKYTVVIGKDYYRVIGNGVYTAVDTAEEVIAIVS